MLILLNIYNISILHKKMNFQNNIFAAYGGAPVPVQERHRAAYFISEKTPRSAGYRRDFPTIIISAKHSGNGRDRRPLISATDAERSPAGRNKCPEPEIRFGAAFCRDSLVSPGRAFSPPAKQTR